MSDDSLSSPATVNVQIIDRNTKLTVEQSTTLENILGVHNLLYTSHPYLVSKISVLEQIAQNLNLKDQELASSFENAIDFHNQLQTAHPALLNKISTLEQTTDSLNNKNEELETYVNQNLALKADKTLSNIIDSCSQAAKTFFTNLIMPDYSRKATVFVTSGQNWVSPKDGWIYISQSTNSQGYGYLIANNITDGVSLIALSSPSNGNSQGGWALVYKNRTITFTYERCSSVGITFYPMKGAE